MTSLLCFHHLFFLLYRTADSLGPYIILSFVFTSVPVYFPLSFLIPCTALNTFGINQNTLTQELLMLHSRQIIVHGFGLFCEVTVYFIIAGLEKQDRPQAETKYLLIML